MSEALPTLFVKTGCPWCAEAMDFLDSRNIAHETCVVTGNNELMEKMVRLSGQTKSPVLDWHGDILADFGVEDLESFLRKKGAF
jgi:glutaredoxin 3